jgi:hypothetical protein
MVSGAVVTPQTETVSGRRSVPIIGKFRVDLDARERARLSGIAQQLCADEPALSGVGLAGAGVSSGLVEAPAVLIGDHSEIPLSDPAGDTALGYRISHLGEAGDHLVISCARNRDFEDYRERVLGLGAINVTALGDLRREAPKSAAWRCLENKQIFAMICATARNAGQLNIMPHIGTGSIWKLGAEIAAATGTKVHICAPPPRLTRRVNDKLWFANRVTEVLGPQAMPPTYAAYGPAALAARVAALARENPFVVVKVPDSAGSAGNIKLDSRQIVDLSTRALRRNLLRMLAGLGWRDRFPVLAEVWDHPVISSPSVQIWVPAPVAGLPVVEGIFEQRVEGERSAFIGAVVSDMPDEWADRLVGQSVRIAYLFQQLGYFGRCSFDAVLAGRDYASAKLHWIECNGRWGGVSVPMTLMNRLLRDWAAAGFMVVQHEDLKLPHRSFKTALAKLDASLFRPNGDDSGIVVLTPGGIELGTGLHFLAVAATTREAAKLAHETIEILRA